MGLRARTILFGTGGFGFFVLLLWWVISSLLDQGLGRFERLGRADLQSRARAAVEDRLQGLERVAADISRWPTSKGEIPCLECLDRAQVDQFAVVGDSNRIESSRAMDYLAGATTELDTALIALMGAAKGPSSGQFARTSRGIYLVAIHQIGPDSVKTSKTKRWVLLARSAGPLLEKELSLLIAHPVVFLPPGVADFRPDGPGEKTREASVSFAVHGGGDPATLLIVQERSIWELARNMRRFLALAFFAAAGAFLAGGYVFLDRLVLRRIAQLGRGLLIIRDQGASAEALRDDGADEIGRLAREINGMLESLRGAHQELVRARDEAEAASRAKSAFLATMSHEMRTPLNGVIGMTEIVLKGRLDPAQREALQMVRGSAEALLTTINDILDYSRFEAGRVDLEIAEVSLEGCLEAPMRLLAAAAHQQGVELTLAIDPDAPAKIFADASRLRQIMTNLAGNAVKFTEKGEVCVEVRLLESTQGFVRLEFSVTDTGIGIAPERAESIFLPFVQGDNSSTRKFEGTGLGLTIAQQLARRMDGRITMESRVGVGSRFQFELKLGVIPNSPQILPSWRRFSRAAPAAVLVKQAFLRRHVVDLLARLQLRPHEVFQFEDLLGENPEGTVWGCIVMDVESAGESDLSELIRLRDSPHTKDARIVLLSRADRLNEEDLAGARDVRSILRRPFVPREFLAVLRKEFRGTCEVLVYIPNPVLKMLLKGILEQHGHRIVPVRSVQEAEQCLSGIRLHAAIIDLDAPEGPAVAGFLRSGNPRIPVIGVRENPSTPGDADEILGKPPAAEELIEALERRTDGALTGTPASLT